MFKLSPIQQKSYKDFKNPYIYQDMLKMIRLKVDQKPIPEDMKKAFNMAGHAVALYCINKLSIKLAKELIKHAMSKGPEDIYKALDSYGMKDILK